MELLKVSKTQAPPSTQEIKTLIHSKKLMIVKTCKRSGEYFITSGQPYTYNLELMNQTLLQALVHVVPVTQSKMCILTTPNTELHFLVFNPTVSKPNHILSWLTYPKTRKVRPCYSQLLRINVQLFSAYTLSRLKSVPDTPHLRKCAIVLSKKE